MERHSMGNSFVCLHCRPSSHVQSGQADVIPQAGKDRSIKMENDLSQCTVDIQTPGSSRTKRLFFLSFVESIEQKQVLTTNFRIGPETFFATIPWWQHFQHRIHCQLHATGDLSIMDQVNDPSGDNHASIERSSTLAGITKDPTRAVYVPYTIRSYFLSFDI